MKTGSIVKYSKQKKKQYGKRKGCIFGTVMTIKKPNFVQLKKHNINWLRSYLCLLFTNQCAIMGHMLYVVCSKFYRLSLDKQGNVAHCLFKFMKCKNSTRMKEKINIVHCMRLAQLVPKKFTFCSNFKTIKE